MEKLEILWYKQQRLPNKDAASCRFQLFQDY